MVLNSFLCYIIYKMDLIYNVIGIAQNKSGTRIEKEYEKIVIIPLYLGWFAPTDLNAL